MDEELKGWKFVESSLPGRVNTGEKIICAGCMSNVIHPFDTCKCEKWIEFNKNKVKDCIMNKSMELYDAAEIDFLIETLEKRQEWDKCNEIKIAGLIHRLEQLNKQK